MFSKLLSITFLLAAASLLANAQVVPSEPGPGAVYTAGETCAITWDGDTALDSPWKDMSIQLMTGSNFQMVHVTTVATNQDGTVSNRFTYPCPEVNPYSAIYFYQFSSPHTDEKTWTTRFTITSPTGATTPPSESTQPGTGAAIPWGTGALADPSQARPPPVIGGGGSASASTGSSSVPAPGAPSSASTPPNPNSASVTPRSSTPSVPSGGSASRSSPAPSSSASGRNSNNELEPDAALSTASSMKLVTLAVAVVSFALVL